VVPIVEFEAARPQLTAVAFRLLGSIHDAEDAVQSTWIKASTAATEDLRSPAAWFTTVLTRVCLDHLRTRYRRREEPLLADTIPAEELAADEHYLRRESISRALMVILNSLTPPQRVAYVLHDLFDVPFQEVAETLGTSPDNAKKHASRARKRIEKTGPATTASDSAAVDAFLSAAAGGDIDRMLALMTGDCVRAADPALLPTDTPSVITGASTIAKETGLFADRIRATTPMVAAGRPVHVIAPGGHLVAIIDMRTVKGLISRIDITRADAHTPIAMPSPPS
jgi:RNA polymerase sigma factor (sigma-70 family)